MRPSIVLFDLDGTIADTAPDLAETTRVILDRHGCPHLPDEEVRILVGGGARRIMQRAFHCGGIPVTDEFLDQTYEEFIRHYAANMAKKTTVFPGLINALTHLQSSGIRLGVVTNKQEGLSRQLLEMLDLMKYFPVVIGGDTLPEKKPHPAPLLAAVSQLGGLVADAVMIGDTAADIDAARAAGMACIAVTFGYAPVPAAALKADAIIDHYANLPDILRHLPSPAPRSP